MAESPKLEFALGSEVSPGHFFKSSFARSFVSSSRDSKSLDYEILDNGTIVEEAECNSDSRNNNYFSLVNFATTTAAANANDVNDNASNVWKTSETSQSVADHSELENLRKKCHILTEENRKLQNALSSNQLPHVQAIDNVFLQTQVDTLQWQIKQSEANRQMYRSLMEQVVRFLDRTRKSLDILREKTNPKDKSSVGRVPRSRSVHAVHAVHADCSPSRGAGASTSSSSSSAGSLRFTRAKSVTQISPGATGFREFTWSVLRRNDPVHCTPPRGKASSQELNKTHDGVVYRRPKQVELNPDDVPPEKLSREAFRLMRTVQSLLATREPDLVRMTAIDGNASSPSPIDRTETSHPFQSSSFADSTALQENGYALCSSSDRGNESSGNESDSRSCFAKSASGPVEAQRSSQSFLPAGVRRSLDATSLNSGSSKTTEEEDARPLARNAGAKVSTNGTTNVPTIVSTNDRAPTFVAASTSTPNKRTKKVEKKDGTGRCARSKAAISVSSAEDESGFSSMSSFQEVGLPTALALSPVKGYHTEVGLPEVPLEKVRHRRWSSTPAEFQALFKQHGARFSSSETTTESLSVWV